MDSVLNEALAFVTGDRLGSYGHPLDDYGKVAAMANAIFAAKLKAPLSPEDCTLFMCLVKIARHAHQPKRDNMTDLAGYAHCTQEIVDERERRSAIAAATPMQPLPQAPEAITFECGCIAYPGEEDFDLARCGKHG